MMAEVDRQVFLHFFVIKILSQYTSIDSIVKGKGVEDSTNLFPMDTIGARHDWQVTKGGVERSNCSTLR